VLLSWSGSMFEYLMPLLVMPTYENTLLDQTCAAAVERQIEYGRQRGVPWGISESGYNTVDASSTTSTAPSACPAWDSSAGWPPTW
jgi:cyclic beta-1,2-glucan synthetase